MIGIYKISIIIPVYNLENLIDRAFESIKSQSIGFENLEVIFIDDKSTDNSANIIKKYSEVYENVHGIFLDENSGFAGRPRNVGLKYATAKYVMFLDPDDYYLENACQLLYNRITSENLDMVSGNFALNKPDNVVRWNHINIDDEVKFDEIEEKPSILILAPSIWSKIYKKKLILENNIEFNENLPGQDALFIYEILLSAKKMLFINIPVVVYCQRDYSKINEKSVTDDISFKKLSDYLYIYEKMYNILHEYNPDFEVVVSSHMSYWSNLLNKSNLSIKEKIILIQKFNKLFNKVHSNNGENNDLTLLLKNVEPNIVKNIIYHNNSKYEFPYNLFYNIERNSIEMVDELENIEDFIYDNHLNEYEYDFLSYKINTVIDLLDSSRYVDSVVLIPELERKNVYTGTKHLDYSRYYGSNSKYVGFSFEYSEKLFNKIKKYLNLRKISSEYLLKLQKQNNLNLDKYHAILVSTSYREYKNYYSKLIVKDLENKKNIIKAENMRIQNVIDTYNNVTETQQKIINKNINLISQKKSKIKELNYDYEILQIEQEKIKNEINELKSVNNELVSSNIWQFREKIRKIKDKLINRH